jgi:4-amino-4-deoxy-L-arabinose transferase-like glycosyltransferase
MIGGNTQTAPSLLAFTTHRMPLAILLFISFWSFFYSIGIVEIDLMEARNLVAAREILQNDSWLIPTMNGEIRITKPPLPTWLAALVSRAVGGTDNLSLLRLPNAAAALLLVLFTYGLAWTMTRDRALAFMAAAVLATNFLVMKTGHRANWDMFCHMFMLGALWAFMWGMRDNRGWIVFAFFGALMGLSFLSKGPVSFYAMLLPFLLSYFWIYRFDSLRQKWRLLLFALILAAVIASLWPLYIMYFHPEALMTVVQQETEAWASNHTRSFTYYLKFPIYSGLWLVVALAALIEPFARKRVESIRQYRFLLLWLALDILLLSLIPEKKIRYLLPAMIPMALLCGTLLRAIMYRYSEGLEERGDRVVIALHTGLFVCLGIIIPGYLFYQLRIVEQQAPLLVFIPIFAAFLALITGAWIFFRRKNLAGLFFLTVLQFCLIAFLYMDYYRDVGISNPEFKSMEKVDSTVLGPEMEIYVLDNWLDIKHVWDLKRKLHRWQTDDFLALLDSGKTVAVISTGDPREKLARLTDDRAIVTTIDWFDYNENNAEKEKTFISLVRLAD